MRRWPQVSSGFQRHGYSTSATSPSGRWCFRSRVTLPLAWRRARPSAVFAVIAVVALVQWSVDVRLFADVALLLALYTVAVRESLSRIVTAMVLLEVGIFLAAFRWHLADTGLLSVVYLTGLAAAALCAGLAVRSASQYLAWMEERAVRLELEQDQRAVISAAEERARIAREMHDIVAHSLSVVVTLADAASVIGHSDPLRAETTMQQVADVGRQALGDMRTMLSALRTERGDVDLGPQPGVADLESLYERVRGTGLVVEATVTGTAVSLPAPVELSIFRIVQEALTNAIKHANASTVRIRMTYHATSLDLRIDDDGRPRSCPPAPSSGGHGLMGMAERANLHGGVLHAGPSPDGGWSVSTSLRLAAPNRLTDR